MKSTPAQNSQFVLIATVHDTCDEFDGETNNQYLQKGYIQEIQIMSTNVI